MSGAQEAVGAAGEPDHFYLFAEAFHHLKILLALSYGAAGVSLPMQQQDGSFHPGREGDGGPLEQSIGQAVHALSQFVDQRAADRHAAGQAVGPLGFAEAGGDVGRAVHAPQVDAGSPGHGSAETGGMADGPGGHVTAVAVAVDAQTVGIHVAPLADLVQCGHQVAVVLAAPVAQHGVDELLPVGGRAARIDRQGQKAGAGENLVPGHE